MIPINKPFLDEDEVEAVAKVLRSGTLTSRTESASSVSQFERAYAQSVRAKHAFAVNSGTAALHLSLLAAGVGHGSEVILPSFTFVSTAETIVLAGATPVFVDIDPTTYCIDLEQAENAITKKTSAIMPVDLYGLPVDMKPIKELSEKHGLEIVEDAAQAHGAEYHGRPVGSFAAMACWSFYASKNMTTGEGGMITTSSDEYAAKLPYMRSHGEKEEYLSSMIGHNYRMPEMEAAIGLLQLRKLPSFVEARRQNAERLSERLTDLENLQLPTVPDGYKHSWYLYTVRLIEGRRETRDAVVKKLREAGIGATVYYRVPIHQMPFYTRFSGKSLPNTEKAAEQVFSLPVHPQVSLKQIEYIAASTQKFLA